MQFLTWIFLGKEKNPIQSMNEDKNKQVMGRYHFYNGLNKAIRERRRRRYEIRICERNS